MLVAHPSQYRTLVHAVITVVADETMQAALLAGIKKRTMISVTTTVSAGEWELGGGWAAVGFEGGGGGLAPMSAGVGGIVTPQSGDGTMPSSVK